MTEYDPEDQGDSDRPDDDPEHREAIWETSNAFASLQAAANEILSESSRRFTALMADAMPKLPTIRPFPSDSFTPLGRSLTLNLGLDDALRALTEPITAAYQNAAFDAIRQALTGIPNVDRFYPPNLRAACLDRRQLEPLLTQEGLPLMWVPRAETVTALLDAPDRVARRRVIGNRWRGITADCEDVLEEITQSDLTDETDYALQAAHALREGHTAAAQALATNLSDTLLRHLPPEEIKLVSKKTTEFALDQHTFRAACTISPLWYARTYYRRGRDPVPRVFNRNASAHDVSRAQYSRINTVIALMLVTSMLKYVDTRA